MAELPAEGEGRGRHRRFVVIVAVAGGISVGVLFGWLGRPPSTVNSGDCVPVFAHDGTSRSPGCMLDSEQNPAVDQRLGGIPVYSDASASTQVGLMVDAIGFVPNAVLPRLAEIKSCYGEVQARISHAPGAHLSASCKALYLDAGWSESDLDGHG
jgi:hypothetical protein